MLIPFPSFPILNGCFLECKKSEIIFNEGSNFYCNQSGGQWPNWEFTLKNVVKNYGYRFILYFIK